MASPSELTFQQRLGCAVGLYVLKCHDLERLMKELAPMTREDDASIAGILSRGAALRKKSLGLVAREFIKGVSGDVESFQDYVSKIIEERNEVVHHFTERFGPLLEEGRHDELIAELKMRHRRASELSQALREMLVGVAEAMNDPETS